MSRQRFGNRTAFGRIPGSGRQMSRLPVSRTWLWAGSGVLTVAVLGGLTLSAIGAKQAEQAVPVESRLDRSALRLDSPVASGNKPVKKPEEELPTLPERAGSVQIRRGQAAAEWRTAGLRNRMNIKLDEAAAIQERHRHTPNIWPADSRRITSGYGVRKDPIHHRPSFHNGLDIAGKTGDPVYAAADGKVLAAACDRLKGNYVLLEHGYGWRTLYMHLSAIETEAGALVAKGDRIGRVGSTGRSTGPHLHYEIHQNGKTVNPDSYLP
ncbi:M23 family metallopeptidase [Paenibacillus thermoaerophilus]|uniref:M23 family metallopeptidase n=1 Tax=Paenibacillus thermoaerophilus TaxID=1215385 RepID=A0ABW2V476_9BACL|nr:M23 family metallopeptidase [Paenibacillus thermoaerophilus]